MAINPMKLISTRVKGSLPDGKIGHRGRASDRRIGTVSKNDIGSIKRNTADLRAEKRTAQANERASEYIADREYNLGVAREARDKALQEELRRNKETEVLKKHSEMVNRRPDIAETERLSHMTPSQRARHERHEERKQKSAANKNTADYRQNVKNVNRQLDEQEKLATKQRQQEYQTRKEDVMGRRQARLDERSMRNNLVNEYRERGVDIHGDVAKQGFNEAKSWANKVDGNGNYVNTQGGWGGLDDLKKRGYAGRHITEAEARRRTWNGLDDGLMQDTNRVKFNDKGEPVLTHLDDQAKFNESLEANRNAIINSRKTASAESTSGIEASSSSSKIDTKGLSRGEQYSLNREMRKQDFFNNNTGNLTEESVRAKLMKDFDLDDAGYDKFTKNTDGFRDNLFNQRRGDAIEKVSMVDNMMGNKVPHIAGGALITAGLVSSMSNSRGQQSNASLYGQSQPYY